jgi:hypothetical protein
VLPEGKNDLLRKRHSPAMNPIGEALVVRRVNAMAERQFIPHSAIS